MSRIKNLSTILEQISADAPAFENVNSYDPENDLDMADLVAEFDRGRVIAVDTDGVIYLAFPAEAL